MRWALLLVATMACAPGVEDLEQDIELAGCGLEVLRICGVDGSHPIPSDVDILIELTEPVSDWDAWIDGVPSTMERDASNDAVLLRPDRPLEAGHTYDVRVRDCDGEEQVHPVEILDH